MLMYTYTICLYYCCELCGAAAKPKLNFPRPFSLQIYLYIRSKWSRAYILPSSLPTLCYQNSSITSSRYFSLVFSIHSTYIVGWGVGGSTLQFNRCSIECRVCLFSMYLYSACVARFCSLARFGEGLSATPILFLEQYPS